MITLYQITEEQKRINYLLEESGGEITPEIEELMTITEANLVAKGEGYAKAIFHYKRVEEAIKAEEERLSKIKKTCQNIQANLKERIANAMLIFEKESLEYDTFKISFRKSTSIEIDESASIPNDYIKVKTEIDKRGLTEAIKSGKQIDGVRLRENKNIQIK